jgi:hypothetical protein
MTETHDPSQPLADSRRREELGEGRDEMNLAELPFASLAHRGDDRTAITYEGWITDKQGQRHYQKWLVGGGHAGLPTEYDERVYVALMKVTHDQGFASRKVPFSIYEVLKIMGAEISQPACERVEEALNRLVGVTIHAEGSFWDNEARRWRGVKTGFHIVEKYWLRSREPDEEVRAAEGVPAYIVWSEDIWASFQAGYIKRLDLKLFYNLESALARRLYRFLDKRMRYQNEYEIDIFELANRLGMARYEYPAHLKRKLQPAFDELIACGYLASATPVRHKGYTRIRFVTRPAPTAEPAESPALPARVHVDKREAALWEQVLKHLAAAMTRATYNSVFSRTRLLALEEGVARIGAPNQATQEILTHRLDSVVREAFEALDQPIRELSYVVME